MPRSEFDAAEVESLLVACHRRCCICHKHAGVKIEIDHIEPASEGGPGLIDNAIPVCFDCHAEIHLYNPAHPKGRRFRASEIRAHKQQWLGLCQSHPEMFVLAQPPPEAGSLERLVSELQFNLHVASTVRTPEDVAAPYEVARFRRAIADGTFVWLTESVRNPVHDAYCLLVKANALLDRVTHASSPGPKVAYQTTAFAAAKALAEPIRKAIAVLLDA